MRELMPEITLADPRNESSYQYVLKLDPNYDRVDFNREFYEHVKRLWNDAGIQKVYQRSNEFSLIDSAK